MEMNERRRSEIWTLPNMLSFLRILMTPVFVWSAILRKPWETFGIFLLAGVTDALDGFTARHFHLKTNLGLWLDPIGDKILMTAAFVVLSFPRWGGANPLPLWLTVICVGRDVLIALAALTIIALWGKRTFRPSLIGKASTVVQVMTIYAVLLSNALARSPGLLHWLYLLTAVLTCLTGVQYTVICLRSLRSGAGSPGE